MPSEKKEWKGFRDRLEMELLEAGVSQGDVARRLGISQGTVSGWLHRNSFPRTRLLRGLGEMLGVRAVWLRTGAGPKLNAAGEKHGEPVRKTLPIPPSLQRRSISLRKPEPPPFYLRNPARDIPLVSWAQAGIATNYEELPADWQETIPAAVPDNTAFAIQLRGDSMEPQYKDGDIAIVMPGQAAHNGDLVIANIKNEGFAFKILNLVDGDPDRIRLTSYNMVYAPMEFSREKFHWIYPVYSVTKRVWRKS